MRKSRLLIASAATVGTLCIAIGGFLATLQFSGNFHEVVPGEYYRSAQPTAAQIDYYAKTYGIRSILNLRGEQPKAKWYQAETAEAQRLGITHANFSMEAERVLTADEQSKLVALLRSMPKPILVHCRAGADRSGLAAALYVYEVAGLGETAAEGQISIRYGHISIPLLSSAYAMDESWEEFEKRRGNKS